MRKGRPVLENGEAGIAASFGQYGRRDLIALTAGSAPGEQRNGRR